MEYIALVQECGGQNNLCPLNYSIFWVFLLLSVIPFLKLPHTLWDKDASTKLFLVLPTCCLKSNP